MAVLRTTETILSVLAYNQKVKMSLKPPQKWKK